MAKVIRGNGGPTSVSYSISLNVIASGSKKWTDDQLDALFSDQPDTVEIVIRDAEDHDRVLVCEVVTAKEFSTGSVGYGLHVKGVTFDS